MAHIDLTYLERFCKGDRARMEKYIHMYLDASPGLFAELAAKAEAGDAEGLAVAAHSLRPQVNYMGAQALFDLLTAIEQCAREKGVAACMNLVSQVNAANSAVIAELRSALNAS